MHENQDGTHRRRLPAAYVALPNFQHPPRFNPSPTQFPRSGTSRTPISASVDRVVDRRGRLVKARGPTVGRGRDAAAKVDGSGTAEVTMMSDDIAYIGNWVESAASLPSVGGIKGGGHGAARVALGVVNEIIDRRGTPERRRYGADLLAIGVVVASGGDLAAVIKAGPRPSVGARRRPVGPDRRDVPQSSSPHRG